VAKAAGFRLTSHCAEDGPAANVTTCLDLLGCERLDHGYHILEDPAVVARCRDEGVTFTVCPTSTAVVYGWPDLTTHPITKMIDARLRVMLNSDDPTMFHTDTDTEYAKFCGQDNFRPELVRQLVVQGVEAAWLDDIDKAAMRRAFETESTSSTGSISSKAADDSPPSFEIPRPSGRVVLRFDSTFPWNGR
jgi:adenosine deaminase